MPLQSPRQGAMIAAMAPKPKIYTIRHCGAIIWAVSLPHNPLHPSIKGYIEPVHSWDVACYIVGLYYRQNKYRAAREMAQKHASRRT
jgi:hypothetical protein